MVRRNELIGKPVLDLDGNHLGLVREVVVDPGRGRFKGLVIGGSWIQGERIVPAARVKNLEGDMILVEDGGDEAELRGLNDLRGDPPIGKRAVTPDGREVGYVDDLEIEGRKVTGYYLGAGLVDNLFRDREFLPWQDVLEFARDSITIASEPEKDWL